MFCLYIEDRQVKDHVEDLLFKEGAWEEVITRGKVRDTLPANHEAILVAIIMEASRLRCSKKSPRLRKSAKEHSKTNR
jgi:hypothetical protein